jgi:ribosomal protein S10
MVVKEKIRIRVRGYDHKLVDAAAEKMLKRPGAPARAFRTIRFPLKRKS